MTDTTAPSVPRGATLEDAVEALATTEIGIVPVLDDNRMVLGIITASQAVKGYRFALQTNLKDLGGAPAGTELMDAVVGKRSALVGHALSEARLPPGTVVVSLRRREMLVIPGESDELMAGDDLALLVPSDRAQEVRAVVEGG